MSGPVCTCGVIDVREAWIKNLDGKTVHCFNGDPCFLDLEPHDPSLDLIVRLGDLLDDVAEDMPTDPGKDPWVESHVQYRTWKALTDWRRSRAATE